MNIFGLSLQDAAWQLEFSSRATLPFALLSDSSGAFASALGLPRFQTGGIAYLARLTLEIADGVIARCVYPVDDPARDAEHALRALRG